MTDSTVRTSTDTHLYKKSPTTNYGKSTVLGLTANGTYGREALVYFASPVPRGATVLSAKLVYRQKGSVAGSVTITCQRYTRSWGETTATWNSQPRAGNTAGSTTSLTKASPNGALWEFNVTGIMQQIADGATYKGFRLWTNYSNANNYLALYSQQDASHRPYLQVTWTTQPDKPTRLKPAHGAVSTAYPKLECDFTDTAGSTALLAMQAQIDTANDFTAPDWDSGAVPVATPTIDTADPTLPNPFPGIANGDRTYWRCRVQDGDGLWSAWSDSVELVRYAKGTINLLNPAPAPNNVVTEFTPPILWEFVQPAGSGVQDHWQIQVLDDTDPKRVLYDTGKRLGADTGWTLPSGVLRDNGRYRLVLRCWDDVQREATTDDAVYAEITRSFTVAYDATINGPDTLSAGQATVAGLRAPWVDLVWTRAIAPDGWVILRDGIVIASGFDIDDLLVVDGDAVTYRWRDYTARPAVSHSYQVKAVVNGATSAGGPTATLTPRVEGIWVLDPAAALDTAAPGVVLGSREFDTAQEDLADTYQVYGAQSVVRAVMGLTGLSGTINGALLRDRPGAGWGWLDMERRIYGYKGKPAKTYRLVLGDLNIPVVLGSIRIAPHPSTLSVQPLKQVWFSWWQNGEHPYAGGL